MCGMLSDRSKSWLWPPDHRAGPDRKLSRLFMKLMRFDLFFLYFFKAVMSIHV